MFTGIYGFIFCDSKVINSRLNQYSLSTDTQSDYPTIDFALTPSGSYVTTMYSNYLSSSNNYGRRLIFTNSSEVRFEVIDHAEISTIWTFNANTLLSSINVLKGVGGSSASAAIPAGGTVMTTIKTFTLPSTASLYLVMAYASVNVATSGWMQMELEGRIVRSISDNGGGMINFVTLPGGHSVTIKGFVSSSVNNATMAVTWNYFPLY